MQTRTILFAVLAVTFVMPAAAAEPHPSAGDHPAERAHEPRPDRSAEAEASAQQAESNPCRPYCFPAEN